MNRFWQTISDLPQTYSYESRLSVSKEANAWNNDRYNFTAYACHLADIIDRMDTALETALRKMPCVHCSDFYKESDNSMCSKCIEEIKSEYRVNDCVLAGMSGKDFMRAIKQDGILPMEKEET